MLSRSMMALLGIFLLVHVSKAPQPQAAASAGQALTITRLDLESRQSPDASGIWIMSTGDILTVMETEGGTVGLLLRSNLSALVVLLGSVSGGQLELTSLNGTSTLEATVSGASMTGTLTEPGPSIQFSAARVIAPIGSQVDGIYQTSLNHFLLHFSSDSDAIPVVVFDIALVGGGISFDIFLGQNSSSDFYSHFVGSSVLGSGSLRITFRGRTVSGSYAGAAPAGFSAVSLLRFCPNSNDFDGDGVVDDCDLCPGSSDPGQADADADGAGDACEVCAGTDDFADAGGDGVPDCVAALGDYAGATGTYAAESFTRADCYSRGTRFELQRVPGSARANPAMDICDLPENPGCQDTVISGNVAVADSVRFSNHGPHDLTIMISDISPRGVGYGDDDDDGRELNYVLGDSLFPNECNGGAVGAFIDPLEPACSYTATFIGACPGIGGSQAVLCLEGPVSGLCPKSSTGTYSILTGTTTLRNCNASLRRNSRKIGLCQGLLAVRRTDED